MSCPNNGCQQIYKDLGSSIYSKRCNISNNQRLFTTNLPAYHHLDLLTRKKSDCKSCPNRCKGHRRLNKQLSHSEILKIKLSQSYFDPKSFRRLKRN